MPIFGQDAFVYACPWCRHELQRDWVASVAPHGGAEGKVVITFSCPCEQGMERVQMFQYDLKALRRLIGLPTRLPWYHGKPPSFSDEVLMSRWQWELDQVDTMDDMMRQFAYHKPARHPFDQDA